MARESPIKHEGNPWEIRNGTSWCFSLLLSLLLFLASLFQLTSAILMACGCRQPQDPAFPLCLHPAPDRDSPGRHLDWPTLCHIYTL